VGYAKGVLQVWFLQTEANGEGRDQDRTGKMQGLFALY